MNAFVRLLSAAPFSSSEQRFICSARSSHSLFLSLIRIFGIALLALATDLKAQTVFQQNANGQAYNYPGDPNGTGYFPSNSNWSQIQQKDAAGNIIAPSNWNVSTGVTSGVAVTINGNATIDDANYTISSLTLSNGGAVSINAGVSLTVSGNINNTGSMNVSGGLVFNKMTNNPGSITSAV